MALKTVQPRIGTFDTRRVPPPPKQANPHYGSPEHEAWRKAIIKRDGYRCKVCGTREGRLYADHIVEIRDGGALIDPANGQMLCAEHHGEKTASERAKRMGLV